MAAIAHLRFVTIHPFSDGNGRLSRTVMDMLLAKSDGTPYRCYNMSCVLLKTEADGRSTSYEFVVEDTKAENRVVIHETKVA